ncbi:hypothetical protein CSUI_002517, partial [Cystoisospora suis]
LVSLESLFYPYDPVFGAHLHELQTFQIFSVKNRRKTLCLFYSSRHRCVQRRVSGSRLPPPEVTSLLRGLFLS